MTTRKKTPKAKTAGTKSGAKKTTSKTKSAGAKKPKTDSPPFSDNLKDGLLDRTDQMFSIMTKGLDLTEATMTLGLNMINRLGTVAQETIINRMTGGAPGPARPETHPQGEPHDGGYQQYSEPVAAPGGPEVTEPNWIQNLLPIVPGGPVRVPFSVNNDSPEIEQKVKLHLEGFAGSMSGTPIQNAGFSIKPATKTIAPMDFEKFLLVGNIPQNVPPDSYLGWVVVEGANVIKIPVRLTIGTQS